MTFQSDSLPCYRVRGVYASGRYVSHLVGAVNARQARESVQAADPRILRVTSITPYNE